MNPARVNSAAALVRLFPRLAETPASGSTRRRRPLIGQQRTPQVNGADSIAASREQMRARLLAMILENERQRRNEPHAS
jgi:hypothetical protein